MAGYNGVFAFHNSVRKGVERDLERVPADVREKRIGLVEMALNLASNLDDKMYPPAPIAKELRGILDEIYGMIPVDGAGDFLDDIDKRRDDGESAPPHPQAT